MEIPEMIDYAVICTTKDCHNENIEIIAPSFIDAPYFICGVCGQQIINIVQI